MEEIITALAVSLVPVGLAVFAAWNHINRKVTTLSSEVHHLKSSRDELKVMVQQVQSDLQEIKLLLARNQIER